MLEEEEEEEDVEAPGASIYMSMLEDYIVGSGKV